MCALLKKFLIALVCVVVAPTVGPNLRGQGVTTASIHGTVYWTDGTPIDRARVAIRNTATGFTITTDVRKGRFIAYGLEPGARYTVTVDGIGFTRQRHDDVLPKLGERVQLEFIVQPSPLELDTITAYARARANAHGGTATLLPDSLLPRLPTLNRDLYDFVRLVPQISTNIGFQTGISGGGVGFRYNNFLINGVSERTLFANATSALAGGKSLPIEAVKEYQVLLAPYDVRYGDFAGAIINTVTKAGDNRLQGSLFAFARSDRLARDRAGSPTGYKRMQYGLSVGGPIIRDRLHFFIAPELQHLTSLAEGPYLRPQASATSSASVSASDLERLQAIMGAYGLTAGSAGAVENENPLTNIFGRLDLALPEWHSRVVAWANYADSEVGRFSRPARDSFPLTTYQATPITKATVVALQLHTSLPGSNGAHNELLVSSDWRTQETMPVVRQPVVHVQLPSLNGGTTTVNTGTHPTGQDNFIRARPLRIVNNLTLPFRTDHVLTLGVSGEWFRITRGGVMGSYGTWTFSSLDSMALGIADRYELAKDFGSARAPIAGSQYGMYIGDQWSPSERFALTVGLRADVLATSSRAPYNRAVDSIFGRRTDEMPERQFHWSPRVGFTWTPDASGRHQFRGGTGIFAGRPPLAWLQAALSSYGIGIGRLRCGTRPPPLDLGGAPPFEPDYRNAPQSCITGLGVNTAPRGDVDLLDRHLRMAQTLRASLAYDWQMRRDLTATAEALITRNVSDFVFVNLNLEGAQSYGWNQRVIYGAITASGSSIPKLRSSFSEVIDLTNTSANHSQQLSARLEKRFERGTSVIASYTFTRARDVQTPIRTGVRGIVNWSSRPVSTRHEHMETGVSLNDIPHRVVLAGTHRFGNRWATEISFYYVGESGSPFTYRAWGSATRGDLNADGSNVNDPIYVPLSALDPNEITFDGEVALQQQAFERFIEETPCLRHQRGQIMQRNSCREPWSNTTVTALRQRLQLGKQSVEVQFDIYNILNMLNPAWGQHREAMPELLEHVRQNPAEPAQPVFRFDISADRWITLNNESAFQLQLGLRYRF